MIVVHVDGKIESIINNFPNDYLEGILNVGLV